MPEGKIALVALIVFTAWFLIGLPLLYLPNADHVPGEILSVKYGEWLLFLATVGLAAATWLLVRGAEKTAERQLRAYVGVTSRSIPDLVIAHPQDVGIFITNHGQTPALKVRYWGDVRISENPLRNALPLLDFRADMLPLNPGQKVPIVFRTNDVLTDADSAAIRNDVRRIYCYGVIEYFDVFGKRRTTTYRFEYGGARLISMSEMAVSDEGNDET